MKNFLARCVTLSFITLLLAGCHGFFEKDNTPTPTPITRFHAEIQPQRLWSTRAGSGAGNDNLIMPMALSSQSIFTASTNGVVTAIDSKTGQKQWQVNTGLPLTSGPGTGHDLVVVGSRKGEIMALRQQDGVPLWKVDVAGEIIAQPAISQNTVVIKAVDGRVHALSTRDGHTLWSFVRNEPGLILRGASAPLIHHNHVIAGFASGTLAKLTLNGGHELWQQTIASPEGAFAIERMVDIDADPILFNNDLYAATYQGKISMLDWNTGRIRWSHTISSYSGMAADADGIYISDAEGYVWSFTTNSGLVNWRQTKLQARLISGPAIMGDYVVVGDQEGYLHWLNKKDGHFSAREKLGSAIKAAPMVQNKVLYALTNNGHLIAYTLP